MSFRAALRHKYAASDANERGFFSAVETRRMEQALRRRRAAPP